MNDFEGPGGPPELNNYSFPFFKFLFFFSKSPC